MLVHPSQLKPGCIVEREVKGHTANPIIPKETVVGTVHIQVLEHFGVENIEVSSYLVNGELFTPEEKGEQERNIEQQMDPFAVKYAKGVEKTKEMFFKWQAGNPVDLPKVREMLIPLILQAENDSGIIFSLHHHVDKENYFFHHFVAKALISAFIAKRMNLPQGDRIQTGLAAYLSDCGMSRIPKHILNKSERLSTEEFNEVKQHPIYSYRLAEDMTALKQETKTSILQHHERMDGSGYPFGLSHQKIHSYARMIAVSDIFHAMVCERPYKPRQSPFRAVEEIQKQMIGKLDLEVVQILVAGLANFSSGTRIRLSDQRAGEIVFIEEKNPTRPMVRMDNDGEIIVLKDHPHLHIEEVLA